MVTPGLSRTSPAWAPVHLALLGALALAGWLGWKAYGPHDPGDPVAASLVALERHNRLTVFSAQLSPVVAADDERLFGMLKTAIEMFEHHRLDKQPADGSGPALENEA